MYQIMDVHPITILIIMSAVMITPFFALATYAFSGASLRKGAIIGSAFLVWGGFMAWVCLAEIPKAFGSLGALIVPVCWTTPTLVLFLNRKWFLEKPLSQHFLVSLQLWRVIGALFLLEMTRGNIPGVFAYPAGLGDIAVAVIALYVLLKYRKSPTIPSNAVMLVIVCGVIDFLSAFFFGFTSSEGPQQIFFPDIVNNTMQFPTGMIPLFLVPYAIFFHALSWLTLKQQKGIK
jgi:hypothetical protein